MDYYQDRALYYDDDNQLDFNTGFCVVLVIVLVIYLASVYSARQRPKVRIENGRIVKA